MLLTAILAGSLWCSPPFRVCVDPGHPSEVSDGFHLLNGLSENWVNWQVALTLKEDLLKMGFAVKLTKQAEKERVTNRRRAEIANEFEADLFLRIHADAGGGTGFTIYYPRRAGTTAGVTGPSADVIKRSGAVARAFHRGFAPALRGELKDNGLKGDELSNVGSKQGAFTGSIFSKVPVMLLEMCFLDNKKDADWIRVKENRTKMAKAIAAGCASVRGETAHAR